MKYHFLLALALPGVVCAQGAQPDTSIKVTFGGFVDGYYAWDFGRPLSFDRSFAGGTVFTTQPARHNEFNVNLAFVEAKLDAPRMRGRLALQAGTSVQSNYSGEPTNGQVSGPSLARHIQEAFAGVKLGNNVWVDGGVFYSHMGMESWASRDNPTYTRSLVAEYSPYYQSGAKLTWAASPKFTAQLDIVNGWQNISENNSGKGAGIRLDLTPSSGTTVHSARTAPRSGWTSRPSRDCSGGRRCAGSATNRPSSRTGRPALRRRAARSLFRHWQ